MENTSINIELLLQKGRKSVASKVSEEFHRLLLHFSKQKGLTGADYMKLATIEKFQREAENRQNN